MGVCACVFSCVVVVDVVQNGQNGPAEEHTKNLGDVRDDDFFLRLMRYSESVLASARCGLVLRAGICAYIAVYCITHTDTHAHAHISTGDRCRDLRPSEFRFSASPYSLVCSAYVINARMNACQMHGR